MSLGPPNGAIDDGVLTLPPADVRTTDDTYASGVDRVQPQPGPWLAPLGNRTGGLSQVRRPGADNDEIGVANQTPAGGGKERANLRVHLGRHPVGPDRDNADRDGVRRPD